MIRFFSFLVISLLIISCKSDTEEIQSTVISPKTNKPISLSKKLSTQMLAHHSFNPDELRLLRNEIFARKGYIFNSDDLVDYFSDFEWYEPRYDRSEIDDKLSKTDLFNIETIKTFEEKLKHELNIDKLVDENYDDFSFKDYLSCINEIKLPYGGLKNEVEKFDIIEAKKAESNSFCDDRLLSKYNIDKVAIAGKIRFNDTLFAVGYVMPADVVFTRFDIVSIDGTKLDEFYIPADISPEDFDPKQERFSSSKITKEYYLIIERWTEIYELDSLDNILSTQIVDNTIDSTNIRILGGIVDHDYYP